MLFDPVAALLAPAFVSAWLSRRLSLASAPTPPSLLLGTASAAPCEALASSCGGSCCRCFFFLGRGAFPPAAAPPPRAQRMRQARRMRQVPASSQMRRCQRWPGSSGPGVRRAGSRKPATPTGSARPPTPSSPRAPRPPQGPRRPGWPPPAGPPSPPWLGPLQRPGPRRRRMRRRRGPRPKPRGGGRRAALEANSTTERKGHSGDVKRKLKKRGFVSVRYPYSSLYSLGIQNRPCYATRGCFRPPCINTEGNIDDIPRVQ